MEVVNVPGMKLLAVVDEMPLTADGADMVYAGAIARIAVIIMGSATMLAVGRFCQNDVEYKWQMTCCWTMSAEGRSFVPIRFTTRKREDFIVGRGSGL